MEAFNRVTARLWGTQTKEQDSLEAQAEHADEEKRKALAAQPPDLDGASRWASELRRLHRAIAAKRG
jgi:hypothetical protein